MLQGVRIQQFRGWIATICNRR